MGHKLAPHQTMGYSIALIQSSQSFTHQRVGQQRIKQDRNTFSIHTTIILSIEGDNFLEKRFLGKNKDFISRRVEQKNNWTLRKVEEWVGETNMNNLPIFAILLTSCHLDFSGSVFR